MTALSEDNIVVRVLLNVLDPSAEQLEACAKKPSVKHARRRASAASRAAGDHRRPARRPANLVIVRRISSSAISISWSDPCLGRSTEQIWCRALANGAAVCALTGRHINRGDPVFRPHASESYVPPSRDLMILAATIGQRQEL
ncbi:DUF3331 domain-containing protein [Burkholderia sp. Bp9140]|uniref:DUF3331 domain-containing protein n=1 Tax=Burkholderia sp. Bp9140 TaxID=2184572 RepID=UPI000F57B497|nr:DUF3331 domain-containing protein [Burkholderia sp. Bp9140]RQR49540.1 DUF3331 domain-containing protein [Burkholderia sp. Bp9140]